MIFEAVLLPNTLFEVHLITLYINKLTTANYININSYSMLNLRIEVIPIDRTLKLGHEWFLRVVKVITSPD